MLTEVSCGHSSSGNFKNSGPNIHALESTSDLTLVAISAGFFLE
ncbi:unnamed protein product, partial [Allacma fusca]